MAETLVNEEGVPLAEPEAVEPEVIEEPEEEVQTDPNVELWRKIAPELADTVGELSPEARESLLLRLAAQEKDKLSNATTEPVVATDEEPNLSRPQAPQVPQIDVEMYRQSYTDQFGADEAKVLVQPLAELIQYVNALGQFVVQEADATDQRSAAVHKEITSYTLPNKLRALLPKVPGSTEGDVANAMAILDSGEATTKEAAIRLAVFNRQSLVKPVPASPEARRKAQALVASQANTPSRTAGEGEIRVIAGKEGFAEIYKAQAAKQPR